MVGSWFVDGNRTKIRPSRLDLFWMSLCSGLFIFTRSLLVCRATCHGLSQRWRNRVPGSPQPLMMVMTRRTARATIDWKCLQQCWKEIIAHKKTTCQQQFKEKNEMDVVEAPFLWWLQKSLKSIFDHYIIKCSLFYIIVFVICLIIWLRSWRSTKRTTYVSFYMFLYDKMLIYKLRISKSIILAFSDKF